MSYAVTNTAIIHELLDEEVIIANLESGAYYSLRGSSVPIWQLLIAEHNVESIAHFFQERFQQDVTEAIASFVQLLEQEGLLVGAQEKEGTSELNLVWPKEFHPPTLEKYDEMKNLLMLDPVHEVDEQGWPSRS